MIQTEEAILAELILHRVTAEESTLVISDELLIPEGDEQSFFKKVFLKPFTVNFQTFEFKHNIAIDYNVLFNLAKQIFEEGDFIDLSAKITQHLSASSKHPNINDGDLFIAKFEDIHLNGKHYRGLGIYKFEDKESFIETSFRSKKAKIDIRKGIGSKKADKACLIIFTEEPYTILLADGNNKEADYWHDDFIGHQSKDDHINNTNDFLTLTKDFIKHQIPADFEVTKADQVDYLNRSVEYFKKHEVFDKQEFEKEVFHHANVINSFHKFDESYQRENGMDISDGFEISAHVVKKQAKAFKSVIKLDKNFHIYIHGNRELIELGEDKKGKFYKIYFEEES